MDSHSSGPDLHKSDAYILKLHLSRALAGSNGSYQGIFTPCRLQDEHIRNCLLRFSGLKHWPTGLKDT